MGHVQGGVTPAVKEAFQGMICPGLCVEGLLVGLFLSSHQTTQEGKAGLGLAVLSGGVEMLTLTGDINVGRWKKRFEEQLNPANMPPE